MRCVLSSLRYDYFIQATYRTHCRHGIQYFPDPPRYFYDRTGRITSFTISTSLLTVPFTAKYHLGSQLDHLFTLLSRTECWLAY